nr:uncharacterized protein LOC124498061 [Dermatophagoides farinae]
MATNEIVNVGGGGGGSDIVVGCNADNGDGDVIDDNDDDDIDVGLPQFEMMKFKNKNPTSIDHYHHLKHSKQRTNQHSSDNNSHDDDVGDVISNKCDPFSLSSSTSPSRSSAHSYKSHPNAIILKQRHQKNQESSSIERRNENQKFPIICNNIHDDDNRRLSEQMPQLTTPLAQRKNLHQQ